MKKHFRNILKKKAQEPRPLDAIKQIYGELANRAGQVQYQVYVYTKELAELNKSLEALNHEGAARQRLDAEAVKAEVQEGAQNE